MRTSIILTILLGVLGILLALVPAWVYSIFPPLIVVVLILVFAAIIVVQIWHTRTPEINVPKADVLSGPLGFAAHQLRSPLSIISGYADLIIDGTYGKTAEGITDAAQKIKAAVNRSLKVIDELLDFNLSAAKRIAFTKFFNCGQTCTAPDYVLVQENKRQEFLDSLRSELENFFQSELTREEIERIKKLAELIMPPKHIPLLRSLIRAYGEMRYSPFAMIPLEVALIESLSAG